MLRRVAEILGANVFVQIRHNKSTRKAAVAESKARYGSKIWSGVPGRTSVRSGIEPSLTQSAALNEPWCSAPFVPGPDGIFHAGQLFTGQKSEMWLSLSCRKTTVVLQAELNKEIDQAEFSKNVLCCWKTITNQLSNEKTISFFPPYTIKRELLEPELADETIEKGTRDLRQKYSVSFKPRIVIKTEFGQQARQALTRYRTVVSGNYLDWLNVFD